MQRTPGQQMPVRMRRAPVTNIRQARDRLEAAQSVAAVDDMSGEEESGDILGRPHSAVQTSLRRLHVNLGHPENNVFISSSHLRTRDATDPGSCTKLRMPCLRSCQVPSSLTTVLSDRSPTSSRKHCDGCEGMGMCKNRCLNQSQTFEIGSTVQKKGCQGGGRDWALLVHEHKPSPAQPSPLSSSSSHDVGTPTLRRVSWVKMLRRLTYDW